MARGPTPLLPERGVARGPARVAALLLGLVLFLPPVLTLFMSPSPVLGLPLSFLYLLVAWGAFVALLAYLSERRRERGG